MERQSKPPTFTRSSFYSIQPPSVCSSSTDIFPEMSCLQEFNVQIFTFMTKEKKKHNVLFNIQDSALFLGR